MTSSKTYRLGRLVCIALWLFTFVVFAENSALHVNEPAPSKDGTIVTTEPAISLKGTLSGGNNGRDSRILWQSNRGFSDLATVVLSEGGQTIHWRTTAPIPLRPGVNHVRVRALGQPSAAAFVNIFYIAQSPARPPSIGATLLHGRQVTYQVINGMAIYQGDLILGNSADVAAHRFRGRFAVNERQGPRPQSATIAPDFLSSIGLWPMVDGVVRVPFTTTGVDAANVNAAVAESNSQLAGFIQWVPATVNDVNFVNFNFDPNDLSGSCESSVGMAGGGQIIGGSATCGTPTILHEMGHALGLFHEQSRMDRNSYVNYLEQNIDKPQHDNFDIYDSGVDSGLFNYASIMEYGPFAFSRDGVSPVIETIPAGIPLGTGLPQYTTGDLDGILRLYGIVPASITVDTNPSGLQVVVDGAPCTSPCSFGNWTLGSQHTLSVPLDANSQTLQTLAHENYIFGRWNAGASNQQTVTVTNSAGDGTLLRPSTSPAITNYLASFIPVHPYSPMVSPANSGTVTPSPAPSTLIINGSAINYFQDRQLVTFTVNPSAGYNFFEWANVALYSFYSNPYTFYIVSDFDSPTTAYLVNDAVVTVTGASPDFGVTGSFPGFAIAVTNPSNGNTIPPSFYTPKNFDALNDGQEFASGAQLTLCGSPLSGTSCPDTPASQSPVTFNINYLFSNWSGSASAVTDALTITVPASGQSTYIANYAPSFRTIVSPSIFCTGTAVTSSPMGTDSTGTSGILDAFLTAGTVNFTAATGTTGLNFVGWSQDFSGSSNPLAFSLQNQVIGTANFNVPGASGALAITAFSPATPAVSSAAFDLTITGTGFTTDPSVTSAYLVSPNGSFSFRSSTLISATQLTIHLQAGDLATASYYQVAVLNVVTSGCNPYSIATFAVANSAGPPSLAIVGSHTGNFSAGQQNAQYTVLVTNSGAGSTIDPVTVTEAVPAGETLVSMSGSGWICPASGTTCTRSDALAPNTSYPAITVTVNVGLNAASPEVNSATVSGGGTSPATSSDSTIIGSPVSVADLVGLTQNAASTALQSQGLVLGLVTTAISNSAPSGSVISQSPLAGTLVSAGSTVNLVVSSGPATLQSIAVTPANPSLAKGLTQQFTATGTYTDNSTQNLTSQVTWASATPSVATIAGGGVATGVGVGASAIGATLGAVHGSTVLTITAATLQSIVVTPANQTINKGLTLQYTAMGTYTDGATQNLTSQVTWASGTPATALVTAGGLATAAATGTSAISATLAAVTGSTLLTVGMFSECDINQDGVTNVADVQRIINEALGILSPGNDLNGDGVVNVADVQIVINAALGLACTAH